MIVKSRYGAAIDNNPATLIDQGAANRSMNNRGCILLNHKITHDRAEELEAPFCWHCQSAGDGAKKPNVSRQFDGSLYNCIQVVQDYALAMTLLSYTVRERGSLRRLP
jgi:hypothetical protein